MKFVILEVHLKPIDCKWGRGVVQEVADCPGSMEDEVKQCEECGYE